MHAHPPLTTPDDPERRRWLLTTGGTGAVGAAAVALPFLQTFAPSERAKALGAGVEVPLADIPPGGLKTVEWRGKPVWVMRRTPEMLAALRDDTAALADPQSRRDALPAERRNAARSQRPEWLVLIGICTHLGCSPTAVPAGSNNPGLPADWPGGYFCPCHGSKFDAAGRVFRNQPAPTNLEIPPHRFASDTLLVIGEDAAA